MNKSEHRHQLIRALVAKNKIHTQAELQALLAENNIQVTQATLSRDIKTMNLSKVREAEHSYYVLNTGSISKWEKRLEKKLYGRWLSHATSCPASGCPQNLARPCPIVWSCSRCSQF